MGHGVTMPRTAHWEETSMRRLVMSIAAVAIAAGTVAGFATPAHAMKKLSDIIVCVREPCP